MRHDLAYAVVRRLSTLLIFPSQGKVGLISVKKCHSGVVLDKLARERWCAIRYVCTGDGGSTRDTEECCIRETVELEQTALCPSMGFNTAHKPHHRNSI